MLITGLLLPDCSAHLSHTVFIAVRCTAEKTVWTGEVEVGFRSNVVVQSPSLATLCLFPPFSHVLLLFLTFPIQMLMAVEDACPFATLPRSFLAQVSPVPERCHSLGDLSRSPTTGRRAATYATSSSANASPLRRVLTRRMNTCPHQELQQPLHTSACAVLLEQPVCSPLSLWHFVSK